MISTLLDFDDLVVLLLYRIYVQKADINLDLFFLLCVMMCLRGHQAGAKKRESLDHRLSFCVLFAHNCMPIIALGHFVLTKEDWDH